MPESWTEITVKDACEPIRLKRRKLLARDYGETGRFPIIDQGQDEVSGWTDDEALLITEELPLIVFGDHTRIFKYVDRPFAVGADGTQLLKPKEDIDPLFFYFACRSLEVPSRGYNRHFTILKGKSIRYPKVTEQIKIASVLWKIQQAINVETDLIRVSRELKEAVMKKLFTEGLNCEPQKETEIGLVPESWKIVQCDDVCRAISVGIVVRPASHYVERDGVPAFRSLNVQEDKLNLNNLVQISRESHEGIVSKSKLTTGDVLIVRTGYPGTSCVVPTNMDGANCIDIVFARPEYTKIRSHFLSRYMNSSAAKLQVLSSKTGLAQQHLNVNAVKNMRLPLPPLKEQDLICGYLATIDENLDNHNQKMERLKELFASLLRFLMSASIRVTDLDIDTTCLESQGAAA